MSFMRLEDIQIEDAVAAIVTLATLAAIVAMSLARVEIPATVEVAFTMALAWTFRGAVQTRRNGSARLRKRKDE